MGRAVIVLLFTLATGAALAQPLGAVRDSHSSGTHAAAQPQRPLAAQPVREPAAERCANLRRELRQIARRQREARTTGEADQFSLRYQQVLEQSSRAGC